jgi:hypothetical protein
MGMGHSFWDVKECLAAIFADKWGLRQKIVACESIICADISCAHPRKRALLKFGADRYTARVVPSGAAGFGSLMNLCATRSPSHG